MDSRFLDWLDDDDNLELKERRRKKGVKDELETSQRPNDKKRGKFPRRRRPDKREA